MGSVFFSILHRQIKNLARSKQLIKSVVLQFSNCSKPKILLKLQKAMSRLGMGY